MRLLYFIITIVLIYSCKKEIVNPYDDPNLDWVVLLSNNITNIQSEWPLPQSSFDEVMLEKYETYDKLYSGIHHYETVEVTISDPVFIDPNNERLNA